MESYTWLEQNISILKKRGRSFTSPLKHYIAGLRQVKSVLLAIHPEQESIIRKMYLLLLANTKLQHLALSRRGDVYTLECLPKNKWTISTDNLIFSDPNILSMTWKQTALQVLIGNVRVCKPFWNEQCQENSTRLWLPTEIDSRDSLLTSSNGSWRDVEPSSWFSMRKWESPVSLNSPMTSYPLSTYTPADLWEEGAIVRARKVRFYPTHKQAQILIGWLHTTRAVYNRGLSSFQAKEVKCNFQALRNMHVTAEPDGVPNPIVNEWELKTPKDVRAGTMMDLSIALKTNFKKLRDGLIQSFSMKYRSKHHYPTISYPHR